jgi:hypothetical protein
MFQQQGNQHTGLVAVVADLVREAVVVEEVEEQAEQQVSQS